MFYRPNRYLYRFQSIKSNDSIDSSTILYWLHNDNSIWQVTWFNDYHSIEPLIFWVINELFAQFLAEDLRDAVYNAEMPKVLKKLTNSDHESVKQKAQEIVFALGQGWADNQPAHHSYFSWFHCHFQINHWSVCTPIPWLSLAFHGYRWLFMFILWLPMVILWLFMAIYGHFMAIYVYTWVSMAIYV